MGTSFEDLMKRMKNAPRVGVPRVTNPKVPTKVERDAAAFAAREAAKPNVEIKNVTGLDQLMERMRNSVHVGMVYADPAFNKSYTLSPAEVAAMNAKLDAFLQMLREKKAKRKQEQSTVKTNTTENTTEE
jgi:hypothetical protein